MEFGDEKWDIDSGEDTKEVLHYSFIRPQIEKYRHQNRNEVVDNEDKKALIRELSRHQKAIDTAKPNPPSILTVPVFGTSMKNVPHKIGKEKLLDEMSKRFPAVFDHTDVTITKYDEREHKSKMQSVAVVARARGEISHLHRCSFKNYIQFDGGIFNYVFFPDFGVERNSTGNRLNPVVGTAFHIVREREGPQMRHGINLFTQDFRNKLPERILNKLGHSVFWFDHPSLTYKDLPAEGLYRVRGGRNPEKQMFSASELEAIQMIRSWNGSIVQGRKMVFRNTKDIDLKAEHLENGSNSHASNCHSSNGHSSNGHSSNGHSSNGHASSGAEGNRGKKKEEECIISHCKDQKGLGVGGSLIKFDQFTHTIPLSWIDDDIVNHKYLNSFSMTCYRCEQKYILVATSSNLDYLMAKCGCPGPCLSYEDWNKIPIPIDSPYHHPGEIHTRLSYSYLDGPSDTLTAIPYLAKLSNDYPSVQFMCNVLLPVLENDWREVRDASLANQCSVKIAEFEVLQKLEDNKERVFFHVHVTKTRFWNLLKCTGFKEVTIECNVTFKDKERIFPNLERGHLAEARPYSDTELLLLYDVTWNSDYHVEGDTCSLTPHADKSEYSFSRKYLNKLPAQFRPDDPYENILSRLLIADCSRLGYNLHTAEIDISGWSTPIQKIHARLNPEQATAFKHSLCLEKGVNIIQGPPGTGKSYLTSGIALGLFLSKPGIVLCTAGSNVACDVMYEHITNIATQFCIKVNVCRIFARGREVKLSRKEVDHEHSIANSKNKTTMRTLHNLVAAHDEYLSGNKTLLEIDTLIREKEAYRMTKDQKKAYYHHVSKIEQKVLAKENIIIMTLGSLAAFRLGKVISKGEKEHHQKEENKETEQHNRLSASGQKTVTEDFEMVDVIGGLQLGTLLVDEAGIISKTSLLPLETLKVPRIILVGDHLQLQPQIMSRSAEEAGLVRSLMELLIVDRKDVPVPMTMLKVQFRAHSDLRKLTSHVTYRDQLRDDISILERKQTMDRTFFEAFPQFKKSRLWVLDHNGKEKKSGSSKANESEAEIVVRTVIDLVQHGHLKTSDVVVLTAYEGQRSLISGKLTNVGFGDVRCKNVDDFQGNEATCIILSVTRSNSKTKLGFLMLGNRVNVAISRAREFMIVCMNLEMLLPFKDSKSHLGKLYHFFVENNLVLTIPVDPKEIVPVE